jgi:hypothetical protein
VWADGQTGEDVREDIKDCASHFGFGLDCWVNDHDVMTLAKVYIDRP